MIHLLHGKDSYKIRRAFEAIRARLDTPDGQLAANSIHLDGASLAPLELLQHVTVVPFFAPQRLVVVEGLLEALAKPRGGRRKKGDDPLEPWRALAAELGTAGVMPDSTTLVLLEGDLGARNAALPLFAPIAQAQQYNPEKERDVAAWIRTEIRDRAATGSSLSMTDGAIRALAEATGADLWAVSNELDKLALLADGEQVTEDIVRDAVANARETRMWDLTDAVVAGNERKAIAALHGLLEEGEPPPLLAASIARQYRQLAVARDLLDARASDGEIARAAGVPDWKVRDITALARRYAWPDVRRAYAFMADADLSVKRGLQDDESALQLLIHQLCALAPRTEASAGRRR